MFQFCPNGIFHPVFNISDENNPYTQRFIGYSVYISNTTMKEDGVLCFKDTSYTLATIPNPTNIICPVHGRFVIYHNDRTNPPYPDGYHVYAFNELCELEVHGKKMTMLQNTVKQNKVILLFHLE